MLSKLPKELIINISEYLWERDLSSLARVCREFYPIAIEKLYRTWSYRIDRRFSFPIETHGEDIFKRIARWDEPLGYPTVLKYAKTVRKLTLDCTSKSISESISEIGISEVDSCKYIEDRQYAIQRNWPQVFKVLVEPFQKLSTLQLEGLSESTWYHAYDAFCCIFVSLPNLQALDVKTGGWEWRNPYPKGARYEPYYLDKSSPMPQTLPATYSPKARLKSLAVRLGGIVYSSLAGNQMYFERAVEFLDVLRLFHVATDTVTHFYMEINTEVSEFYLHHQKSRLEDALSLPSIHTLKAKLSFSDLTRAFKTPLPISNLQHIRNLILINYFDTFRIGQLPQMLQEFASMNIEHLRIELEGIPDQETRMDWQIDSKTLTTEIGSIWKQLPSTLKIIDVLTEYRCFRGFIPRYHVNLTPTSYGSMKIRTTFEHEFRAPILGTDDWNPWVFRSLLSF